MQGVDKTLHAETPNTGRVQTKQVCCRELELCRAAGTIVQGVLLAAPGLEGVGARIVLPAN